MICVSVSPKSRTLAKVDLLNAAHHGDLVELCLDQLIKKDPNFSELLACIDKPIIVSCRKKEDGGEWTGTEEERITLLRSAIVAGPAYIELDLDIAKSIPRFGDTKRVISFTRLDRPELDIEKIFDEAANAQADIVKFCWPTPNIDFAWPLMAAISQKRFLPVVGQGMGRAELTFSLLGLKYKSPWIYAALEKGMEAHRGQANVHELRETYHADEIDRKTKFIMVAGFGHEETKAIQVINASFKHHGINRRCLPFNMGKPNLFPKRMAALKIKSVILNRLSSTNAVELVGSLTPIAKTAGAIDLLTSGEVGSVGDNKLLSSLISTLEESFDGPGSIGKRNVLILGAGPESRPVISVLKEAGALVTIAAPDPKQSQATATELQVRFVPYAKIYDTLTDLVVISDPAIQFGSDPNKTNLSLFRPDLRTVDLCYLSIRTDLHEQIELRQAKMIHGHKIFRRQVQAQFEAITGKSIPDEVFERCGIS